MDIPEGGYFGEAELEEARVKNLASEALPDQYWRGAVGVSVTPTKPHQLGSLEPELC